MKRFLKLLPLLIIIAISVTAYILGFTEYISFDMLKEHRGTILAWVDKHPILAPLSYIGFYTVGTAVSFPGAGILTMTGGFVFGQPWATIYTVIGATAGASIIFSICKTAMGAIFRERAKPFLKKMEEGFQKNQASYLLFLRFVPLFPFWIINIAPALFNVPLWTYVWTTFIGIIPGSFAYTQAGTGIGAILDSGEELTLEGILNIHMKIALIALAILALVPIIVKQIRKKK